MYNSKLRMSDHKDADLEVGELVRQRSQSLWEQPIDLLPVEETCF